MTQDTTALRQTITMITGITRQKLHLLSVLASKAEVLLTMQNQYVTSALPVAAWLVPAKKELLPWC
jgi:hypothetical protein